jgi:hypothetical protein
MLYLLRTTGYSDDRIAIMVAKQLGRIPCIAAGTVACRTSVMQHEQTRLANTDDETYVEWPFFCKECDADIVDAAAKDTWADRVDAELQLYNLAAALAKKRLKQHGVNVIANHLITYPAYMTQFRFLLSESYPIAARVAFIYSVGRYMRHGLLNDSSDCTKTLLDACFQYTCDTSQLGEALG